MNRGFILCTDAAPDDGFSAFCFPAYVFGHVPAAPDDVLVGLHTVRCVGSCGDGDVLLVM
jgi:hypothetical protein